MRLKKTKMEEVKFPLIVFETAYTKEDLEDWLLTNNPKFLRKIRKAREDDTHGKGKDWDTLKRELCINLNVG